ncbi:MAG: hypothetical protein WCJ26_12955 [bacterium]
METKNEKSSQSLTKLVKIISAGAVVLLLFQLPLSGFSQIYLGYTVQELIREHPDTNLTLNVDSSGFRYAKLHFKSGIIVYLFNDSTDRVNVCLHYTNLQGEIKGLVRVCSEKYTATSENHWTFPLNDGKLGYIWLKYFEEDGIYAFIYSDREL